MNREREQLEVACEYCDKHFTLPRANTHRLLMQVLFFAQCPHCGGLRNESSKSFPYPRCGHCNCPIAKGKSCRADYMIVWRRKQKSRFTVDLA